MSIATTRLGFARLTLLSALVGASTIASAATPASKAPPLQDSDFTVIDGGRPYDETAGKIEVVEFFNYICPACNSFEPLFQKWKAKLPKDVRVTLIPADFRDDFAFYARVYYAADLLGLVDKTHHAVYKAIHEDHQLPGEGESLDPLRIAKFYAQHGTTAQAFMNAMDSFAVNTRMHQGHAFEVQCRLQGTPTLVVAGKYLVKGKPDDFLRVASQLIDRERKRHLPRRASPPPKPAPTK